MSRTLAVSFSNFGPYHLARLRALADALAARGGRLIAYETAGTEQLYPWRTARRSEPFEWVTLFPARSLESISSAHCARAMRQALARDRPDAIATAGYFRPETTAALGWARRARRPAILMSESQAIDHPRVWWKETIKGLRVRRFSSALVGGPRHRDYLVSLGMPWESIALGYNAVDNLAFARAAEAARRAPEDRRLGLGLPEVPFFLAVNRFVPEKNLPRLIAAFAIYRRACREERADPWDLVLCGDGSGADEVEAAVRQSGCAEAIHRPGFLQADELPRWYAFASAFVHPSLMEPWGLVVNEAAACGLPLLVSERAGCVDTLVPLSEPASGARFDPERTDEIVVCLRWVAGLPQPARQTLGQRASELVAPWGPDRFASGLLEALDRAGAGAGAGGFPPASGTTGGKRRPHLTTTHPAGSGSLPEGVLR
jgi:glycosyltransferase involved in cell wall biosynthesis